MWQEGVWSGYQDPVPFPLQCHSVMNFDLLLEKSPERVGDGCRSVAGRLVASVPLHLQLHTSRQRHTGPLAK